MRALRHDGGFGSAAARHDGGFGSAAARRAVAAVAAAAVLAAACGRGPDVQADPKAAVEAAIDRMSEWDGSTVTLRLEVAQEDLPRVAELMEDEDAARYLTSSTVTISSFFGEDLADTADDVMAMTVVVGGIHAFEFRSIRGELYLRSDVRALMAEFAPELDADAEIAEAAEAAEAFGIDFLEEAAAGAWIQLTGAEQMAAMLKGMGAVPGPQELDPDELASEFGAASQQLLDRIAVAYVGADGAGEHVQATTTGAELFDAFAPILEASFGPLWEQFGAGASFMDEIRSDPGFQEFAATTIPLELWLDGGELRQVGFDVVQLLRLNPGLAESEEDAELAAELDRFLFAAGLQRFGGDVETPTDAIQVDLFELAGRVMGALGGMGENIASDSGSASTDV